MDLSLFSGLFTSPWNIIRTIVDISIVAYLVYRLFWLIRDTRAEQLLRGVLILVLFSMTVSFFKLELLGWLINKAWLVFVIILPIVFQPELRRILEQIGRGKFFSSRSAWSGLEKTRIVPQEIEKTAAVLSERKVGALIVIERETMLNEYLDSGCILDAEVSSALLINIFEPNTPLHDGAVIVKNGRIARAGCFLPLSVNPRIDPLLGTRHRAAIGITELTDALVIVVSEETGTISLVRGGQITRYLDHTLLETILENELLPKQEVQEVSWLRRILNGNRKEKDTA